MSVALSLAGLTAPAVVASPSGQPHPSLKIDKQPISSKSIRWGKNLVLKENTAATLALIGVDKAASHIDVTAAQEFDVEMEKDSCNEESDGVPSDQDLKDDKEVSLLSDKEDEETASVETTVDKAVEGKVTKPLSQIGAQRTNWMKLLMMKTSSLVVRGKNARNMAFNPILVPEMDQSVSIPQFLQLDKRRKVRQTMCLSKLCSEA